MVLGSPARLAFRLVAIVWISTFIFGDLWRDVHLATVHHVVCPEHGELMDVAELPRIDYRRSNPGKRPEVSRNSTTGRHHEHCSLAAVPIRPASSRAHDAMLAFVRVRATIAPEAPVLIVVVPTDALAYAPKTSPPV